MPAAPSCRAWTNGHQRCPGKELARLSPFLSNASLLLTKTHQPYVFVDLGVTSSKIKGLVNGAPYAVASLVGRWLNAPLNKRLGRRGLGPS